MDMEVVRIPKIASLFAECTWLDNIVWYSQILQKHVAVGGMIDGQSVPNYVMQSISHDQKSSTFVSPDIRKIISGIADLACVVGTAGEKRRLQHKLTITPEKTFNDEEMARLRRLTKELGVEIYRYGKMIHKIKTQQKKCWELSKVAARKLAVVDKDRRQAAPTEERHYQKYLVSYEELLKQLTLFMEMKDNGQAIKGQMTEISTAIKSLVVTAITEKTKKVTESLMMVTQQAADTSLPTTHIVDSLMQVDHNSLANAIFNATTEAYHYPNIEHYKQYPEFTLPISKGYKNTKSMDPVRLPKGKVCGNGYYVIAKTNEEVLPGFFETKKDLKVKMYMTIMEGKIGYGWTRLSKFCPRKTWGYFHIQ